LSVLQRHEDSRAVRQTAIRSYLEESQSLVDDDLIPLVVAELRELAKEENAPSMLELTRALLSRIGERAEPERLEFEAFVRLMHVAALAELGGIEAARPAVEEMRTRLAATDSETIRQLLAEAESALQDQEGGVAPDPARAD
jgi:hypothetical protein